MIHSELVHQESEPIEIEREKLGLGLLLALKSSFLVCSFFVVVYCVCGLPTYETNDDVVMSMLCGGAGFSNLPNEHMLYTHYMVGQCLKRLYMLNKYTPWYGFYLLFAQLLSTTLIVSLLVRKYKSLAASVLVVMLFLVGVSLRASVLFQFTTTAAIVASAGSLLFFECLFDRPRYKILYVFGGILSLMLSALIRHESALLVLVLTAIALTARTLVTGKWKKFFSGGLCILVGAVMVVGLWLLNTSYYARSEQWSEFYRHDQHAFNLLRGYRFSCENDKARAAMEKAGWLPVDLEMFKTWGYLDRKLYDADKLEVMDRTIDTFNPISLPTFLESFGDKLMDLSLLPAHLTLLACFLLLCCRPVWLISAAFYSASVLALMVLLLGTKYLPTHTYAAMVCTSALFAIYSLRAFVTEKVLEGLYARTVLMLTLILVAALPISYFRERTVVLQTRRDSFIKSLGRLAPTSHQVFVCWTCMFPYELVRPFDALPTYFRDLRMIGMNYLIRTPINRQSISNFGIGDLFNELDTPGLFMVAEKSILSTISSYVQQHYGKTPEFLPVFDDQVAPLEVYKVKLLPFAQPYVAGGSWKLFDSVTVADCAPRDYLQLPMPGGAWVPLRAKQVSRNSQSQSFVNTGIWPTLIYSGPLSIKLSDFSHFILRVTPSDWITVGRNAHIQLQINGNEARSFSIPYRPGGQQLFYSFDLDSLNLAPSDKITSINVVLFDGINRSGREKPGDTIVVQKVGFVRRQTARAR